MNNTNESNNQDLFHSLGFQWDRSIVPQNVPIHDVNRTCFRLQKMLAQYVWDASVLEGNPFTYPQVKTILDGVTVGGHKLSDQDQVRNLASSTKELLRLVKSGEFKLDKETFTSIHAIVAREEAFELITLARKMIPNAMKIMVAGGREVMFGDEQYKIFEKGANAFVIGDYLTTQGKTPADDIAELEKHGYKIKRERD
jgi:hypothetical protein